MSGTRQVGPGPARDGGGARRTDAHVAVVLPVYNEVDSIGFVLAEVAEAAARLRLTGVRTSVVIVDDESPDGTGAAAVDAAELLGLELVLVTGTRNGLGDAMLRGLAAGLEHGATAVVTLDGDGQHNPFDIPTVYRAFMARGADIAIGSRWTRGGRAPGTTPGRALGSRFGNWAFRVVSGTRGVKDATTSFRVYSPAVLRFLLASGSHRYQGYSFFSTTIALAEAAGFVITEVPIEFRPRYSGQSKLNAREVKRYFRSLTDLRAERRRLVVTSADDEPYRAVDEVELLSTATAWNRFVIDSTTRGIDPASVATILEVGSGRGGITAELLEHFPHAAITALEPDAENHRRLAERFADEPRVAVRRGVVGDVPDDERYDLAVYVNVLEHIEDDRAELKAVGERLVDDGRLAVFVPAIQGLYGPIDAKSGHFRRYSLAELRSAVEGAGFDVQLLDHVERLGVAPYWLVYRALNKSTMAAGSTAIFDRVYVPVMRAAERALRPLPFGKNLACVAVRSR